MNNIYDVSAVFAFCALVLVIGVLALRSFLESNNYDDLDSTLRELDGEDEREKALEELQAELKEARDDLRNEIRGAYEE